MILVDRGLGLSDILVLCKTRVPARVGSSAQFGSDRLHNWSKHLWITSARGCENFCISFVHAADSESQSNCEETETCAIILQNPVISLIQIAQQLVRQNPSLGWNLRSWRFLLPLGNRDPKEKGWEGGPSDRRIPKADSREAKHTWKHVTSIAAHVKRVLDVLYRWGSEPDEDQSWM